MSARAKSWGRTAAAGLRVAIAMFTAVPVPRSWHGDPRAAAALPWLPLVGAALGGLAGLPAALLRTRAPSAMLFAGVLAVATLAALTRGLHLDGLADTADGLGSRAPAQRALEIMRRSDIGPFGVVTLVVVLLVDVAAVADLARGGTWQASAVLAVAAATGRLSVVQAAGARVPPARADGFGALVAARASRVASVVLTLLVLAAGAGCAWAAGASPIGWPLAQGAALLVVAGWRRHVTHRLGGTTGDVFGALIEIGTAATLLGLVLTLR